MRGASCRRVSAGGRAVSSPPPPKPSPSPPLEALAVRRRRLSEALAVFRRRLEAFASRHFAAAKPSPPFVVVIYSRPRRRTFVHRRRTLDTHRAVVLFVAVVDSVPRRCTVDTQRSVREVAELYGSEKSFIVEVHRAFVWIAFYRSNCSERTTMDGAGLSQPQPPPPPPPPHEQQQPPQIDPADPP
ncbi:hypothetical protein Scep_010527 [Stephania cephalantha]|uniref:Uncharacterized protein n=1 Tax=Stephania cephalantha TaxID=152367 RepID=A0AAP0PHB9_9MAGN